MPGKVCVDKRWHGKNHNMLDQDCMVFVVAPICAITGDVVIFGLCEHKTQDKHLSSVSARYSS